MPRPRKAEGEQRGRVAKCTLTTEEELTVKLNAAAANLSVAEFTRRRLLGLTVTPPASKVDAQLLSEINRIGVNVNQFAFSHNAGREFRGDWEAVRDELSRVLAKVARAYVP